MIRKLLNGDIDRVADIWLKTNLKAHYFISNQYWKSNYELVKEMMSQSEVYVFEADKMIQGFVGSQKCPSGASPKRGVGGSNPLGDGLQSVRKC